MASALQQANLPMWCMSIQCWWLKHALLRQVEITNWNKLDLMIIDCNKSIQVNWQMWMCVRFQQTWASTMAQSKLIICLSCKHRPDCIVVGHSTEFCPKDCNESAQMERFLESFGMGTVTIDHSLMHCASSVCDITLWQLMWGVMLMHDWCTRCRCVHCFVPHVAYIAATWC